MHGQQNIKS